jgi:hypothetical protein
MRRAQPTNQKAPGGNNARRPYRRYALRLYYTTDKLILILILIDRLSHLAAFPSNEISKKLEKELKEGRKQARKRKERKGRRERMMMLRTTKGCADSN